MIDEVLKHFPRYLLFRGCRLSLSIIADEEGYWIIGYVCRDHLMMPSPYFVRAQTIEGGLFELDRTLNLARMLSYNF